MLFQVYDWLGQFLQPRKVAVPPECFLSQQTLSLLALVAWAWSWNKLARVSFGFSIWRVFGGFLRSVTENATFWRSFSVWADQWWTRGQTSDFLLALEPENFPSWVPRQIWWTKNQACNSFTSANSGWTWSHWVREWSRRFDWGPNRFLVRWQYLAYEAIIWDLYRRL